MAVKIILPEPPSANRYWRNVNGMMLLSRQAREYKRAVEIVGNAQRVKPWMPPTQCAVTLRWFRSRKSGDLDNRIKIVLDALQGIAYQWDSQVIELHAFRADDKDNPRVEIEIVEAA